MENEELLVCHSSIKIVVIHMFSTKSTKKLLDPLMHSVNKIRVILSRLDSEFSQELVSGNTKPGYAICFVPGQALWIYYLIQLRSVFHLISFFFFFGWRQLWAIKIFRDFPLAREGKIPWLVKLDIRRLFGILERGIRCQKLALVRTYFFCSALRIRRCW